MKNRIRNLALAALALVSFPLLAAKKDEARVQSLESFLDSQAAITGQRYLGSDKVKGKEVRIPADFPLTKNGSEIFLTHFLVANGLMRVPTGEVNVYFIDELRNAAQAPIPSFEASASQAPSLPETFDMVTLNYKAMDRERCRYIQRFIVNMVPRFGRADCFEDTGHIVIVDTARNLKRIYDFMKAFDVKPLPEKAPVEKAPSRKSKVIKKSSAPAKAAPAPSVAAPVDVPSVAPAPSKPEAEAPHARATESVSAFSTSGALMEAAFDNEPMAELEAPVESVDTKDSKSELSSSTSSSDGSSSTSPDSSTSTNPKYPGG